jgi:hypothetical protein
MAITASGAYGLTLEKMLLKTQTGSLEAAIVWCLMVTDTEAPNFDTHDFVADIAAEVTPGAGYTAGGMVLTANTVAVGSPAAGQIRFDSDNPAWATSTITSAMAAVLYFTTGSTATDQLIYLADFVTAATSSNGTFTITVAGDGWFYIDYTP